MKKYVDKLLTERLNLLLTERLNLSYFGTLSSQGSNDRFITISGSYGWN